MAQERFPMFELETIKRANEAEEQHQILARRCVHKADGCIEITKEHDAVAYVDRLLKTMRQVSDSSGSMSTWVKGMGRMVPKFTRLGEDLHLACRQYREYMFV